MPKVNVEDDGYVESLIIEGLYKRKCQGLMIISECVRLGFSDVNE